MRLPAQLLASQFGVGHQAGWVTLSTGCTLNHNLAPLHHLCGVDDLLHRKAIAIANVTGLVRPAIYQRLQGEQVSFAQIGYGHIVSDASTVRCVVVAPKHADVGTTSRNSLQHQRNQMHLRFVALSQLALWISTRSVEITQANRLQAISCIVASKNLLNNTLGPAVRIDRLLRMALIDGCVLRLAESSGSGGKNQI